MKPHVVRHPRQGRLGGFDSIRNPPARDARFRAVREGYYEVGSQIVHLPPAR